MKELINYKTGFYAVSIATILLLGLCIFLFNNNASTHRDDERFRSELSKWVESNSDPKDSVALTELRKNKSFALFPGILSEYLIVRKDATVESDAKNSRNSAEKLPNQRNNQVHRSIATDGTNPEHNDSDHATQLSNLTESNFELRKKLESYGYLQFKTETGVLADYVGELKNDQPHGYGTAIFSSGKRYEGTWDNGKKVGEGIYYYKNNERYEGAFLNNVREGEGTYYFSNGDRYIGSWKGDQRDGQGYILKKNGSITKNGLWKNDKPVRQ
jgi:hypothetical protein